MGDADEPSDGGSGRRTKVVRLIEEYELATLGPEMERRWTSDGDDRLSLRALADHFNQRLLETKMTEAGMQPLSGEIENTYRLLTDDDVGSADETRTRRRLERNGVDVERLQSDFVTYQAIRTYLKNDRGAEHATDDRPRTVVEGENIQRLRGRTKTVTEGRLKQLQSADHIRLGEFRVFAEINVLCEDCGARYEVEELLERGGCECSS
ncbi:rod-determining factor RdfA [Halorubrum sp. HHNYT27]|uniref:rod-determining factor RdfA n=1 Tax=Halorubrum sp. HHNYT27 TaxID=3402275 RepID=UPI003EBBE668